MVSEKERLTWKSQSDASDIVLRRQNVIGFLLQKGVLRAKDGMSLEIANDSLFRNIIFSAFAMNYAQQRMKHVHDEVEHHMKEKGVDYRESISEEKYSMLKLGNKTAFVFSRDQNSPITLPGPFVDKLFLPFQSSSDEPAVCVPKNKLLAGLAQAYHTKGAAKVSILDAVKCLKGECQKCKDTNLAEVLTSHLPDYSIGHAFGGLGFYIDVNPDILSVLMKGYDDYYVNYKVEELLNDLWSAYLGLKYQCPNAGSDEAHEPLLFNEVDIRLSKMMKDKQKTVIIEQTTITDFNKEVEGYIRDKIQNFHSIRAQIPEHEHHMILSSLCKEKRLQATSTPLKKHVDSHDMINVIGIDDKFSDMNLPSWPEDGFHQLRDVFDSVFNRIDDSVSRIFK